MALLVSVTGVLTWPCIRSFSYLTCPSNFTHLGVDCHNRGIYRFCAFFCTMYSDRALLGELIRLAGWSKYSFWSNSLDLSPTIPLARHGHFHVILGIHFYLYYLTCIMSFPHVHVDKINHLWDIPLLLSTPYIHLVFLLSLCIQVQIHIWSVTGKYSCDWKNYIYIVCILWIFQVDEPKLYWTLH